MIYDFSVDGYEDHGPSVLDNGLPELPKQLEPNQGVAVARWVDDDFGVVKVVYRNDDEYDFDVSSYVKVDGEWESTNGGGGSNWHTPPFVRYPGLATYGVSAGHQHQLTGEGDEPPIRVIDGGVGEGIATIEIVADGRTRMMPIESPIGAWVAGYRGEGPVRWIARDEVGRIAAEGDLVLVDPERLGMPFPPTGSTFLIANVSDDGQPDPSA